MKRVLFLDIDGVLNSHFWTDRHQKEISDGTLIDEATKNEIEYARSLNKEILSLEPLY